MNENRPSFFIDKKSRFTKRKTSVNSILNKKELPSNIFSSEYKWFKFLEFDEIFTEHFYNYFSNHVKQLEYNFFTFYTLDPDPEKYFFKFFKEFSVIDFSINDDYDLFLNKLHSPPKDSPADALMYNSNEIILFCDDLSLFIYGNRGEEFAIVVSNDGLVFEKFISNYPIMKSLSDVKDYIESLLPLRFSNAPFTERQVSFYSDLIKNYD